VSQLGGSFFLYERQWLFLERLSSPYEQRARLPLSTKGATLYSNNTKKAVQTY